MLFVNQYCAEKAHKLSFFAELAEISEGDFELLIHGDARPDALLGSYDDRSCHLPYIGIKGSHGEYTFRS